VAFAGWQVAFTGWWGLVQAIMENISMKSDDANWIVSRRRSVWLLGCLFTAWCIGCGPTSAESHSEEPRTRSGSMVGRPLPDLRLAALNGGRGVQFADLRGKVVLLDVWASWCAPCQQELPLLDDMAGRLRSKGIEIVAVSIDDSREDAEGFLRSRPRWSIRLAHDPDGKLAGKLRPPKMPSSYIVDRKGVIRQVNAGFENGDAEKIERRLVQLAER
jgi:cytochrome c biogenesis protein CcmG, thiol:disulfide interchange protein DsbE